MTMESDGRYYSAVEIAVCSLSKSHCVVLSPHIFSSFITVYSCWDPFEQVFNLKEERIIPRWVFKR